MEYIETYLRALAERQHGVFTRSQLEAAGMTARQVERRLAGGVLVACHRGVYRLAGVSETFEQRAMAACLAGAGVASHRCAAALWGLRRCPPRVVEVTVGSRRQPALAGVVTHTSVRLTSLDTTRSGPIPVTTPARTLLDLGAVTPRHVVASAMEDALHRGLVSHEWLDRTLLRTARRGRNGSAVLRSVVAERDRDDAPTESVLEDELLRVLRRAGLPAPVRQYRIEIPGYPPIRLDAAYVPQRLALEGQSVTWHTGRESLQRDCEKHNLLTALGWRLLQFTWDDLRRRPAAVAEAVRRALAPQTW